MKAANLLTDQKADAFLGSELVKAPVTIDYLGSMMPSTGLSGV